MPPAPAIGSQPADLPSSPSLVPVELGQPPSEAASFIQIDPAVGTARVAPRDRQARILVVDDNGEMLDIYRKILAPDGSPRAVRLDALEQELFGEDSSSSSNSPVAQRKFDVDLVPDGQSALMRVIASHEEKRPFAMAFVDIRMPGGWDGLETIRQLWLVDPEIHIVVCSAYSDYSWEEILDRLGHAERFVVLRKPFDVTEVRQLAHSFCERWLKHRQADARLRETMGRLSRESSSAREALDASVRRTQRILNCFGDIVFVFDRDWCVNYLSPAAEELFGLRAEQVVGKNFWFVLPGSEKSETYRISHDSVGAQMPRKAIEFCMILNRLVEVSVCPSGDEVYLSIQDLSGRDRDAFASGMSVETDDEIHCDRLTGLPDRLSGLRYLQHASSQSTDRSSALAVILCDIDRLRELNELAGCTAVDRFLAESGRRMQALISDGAFVARTGGGEFLIVLKGEHARNVDALANRVAAMMAEPYIAGPLTLEVTVSIGFASGAGGHDFAGYLMRKASAALALAKADGGGVARSCEDEAATDWRAKAELRHEMGLALQSGLFELFYQPQFSLFDGRLVGAEALIRWRHPRWGLLAPADFLQVAEESSLISRIDKWVIDRACGQFSDWFNRGMLSDEFTVSVNVSAREICDEQFPATVRKAIDRHRMSPARLKLEITETLMIRNLDQAVRSMSTLKAIGVGVALDDFGVGHSNLDYVKRFPIDSLKIDRGFVKALESEAHALLLIGTIVRLGKSLNLSVVAEGVENESQREFLREIGCDVVQGHLTGRPVAAEAFERFLRKR